MVTGFDYLAQDKALQEHWLRRLVAIIIDSIIIFAPISFLFHFLGMSWFFPWWWAGAVLFLYAALFDSIIGGTVGKMLMQLKAVSVTGQLNTSQALMRNVSKVFAPLLLLDWIIGMAVDTRDPRQKWTDQLARTSVIKYGQP
jgi:uncharacterized RDD family membrane protein YckC